MQINEKLVTYENDDAVIWNFLICDQVKKSRTFLEM